MTCRRHWGPGSGVHYFHPIPLARIQVHGHMVLPNCRGCWEVKCVCLVEKEMWFHEHLALPLPHNIKLNITKYLNLTLLERDLSGKLADR